MSLAPTAPQRCPTHPGIFLREEVLPNISLTESALASALGISRTHLHDLLNGRAPIDADTAVRLGSFFGVSPETWLTMQDRYDVYQVRQRLSDPPMRTPDDEGDDSLRRAHAEIAIEGALSAQASARFLRAWLKGVRVVGPSFFEARRPGRGQTGDAVQSLDMVQDKWDVCPNPEAVEKGIDTLSHGEAALLAAMCSFYNPEWGSGLLRRVGVVGLADLASKLDRESREIVSELLETYTGF